MRLSRRNLLIAGGGLSGMAGLLSWPAGWRLWQKHKQQGQYPVSFVGPDPSLGHRLRQSQNFDFATAHDQGAWDVVIVGGGVSGLSAARYLAQNTKLRVALLETEVACGGNSRALESGVTAYPLGAHYLPLANAENHDLKNFLREINVITGEQNGSPVYNELFLCADPEERLLVFGRWVEGMVPKTALLREEQIQIEKFLTDMTAFKDTRGSDGRPLFQVPVEESSQDANTRKLDRESFANWLQNRYGELTPALDWYLNYCMQDDYGLSLKEVSAWAGIHYFASRRGIAANANSDTVLTWPEGNGFLVKGLQESCRGGSGAVHIFDQHLALKITESEDRGVLVKAVSSSDLSPKIFRARRVILAVPRFVGQRLLGKLKLNTDSLHYSPWLVANLHLKGRPKQVGFPSAWDNVRFRSQDLGYIVATHQSLQRERPETVFTFYKTFPQWSGQETRERLLALTPEKARDLILPDLLKLHPDIESHLEKIEITRWGHGMAAPTVGFVWGPERQNMLANHSPFYFAHSDQSGFSLFEEAFARGLAAARDLVRESKMR